MAKARKPDLEPCTVTPKPGVEGFNKWLDLVFSTAKEAGERQMKINEENRSAVERMDAARILIRRAAAEAARKRRGGGAGEAA